MSTTTHDIDKLPKWAQDHITALNRDLAEARLIAAKASRQGPTAVAVGHGYDQTVGDTADYWADDHTRVRFALGNPGGRWMLRNYIDVRILDWKVKVYGSDSLDIMPQASNVVDIGVRH